MRRQQPDAPAHNHIVQLHCLSDNVQCDLGGLCRNMYRGTGRMYAWDGQARQLAQQLWVRHIPGIDAGWTAAMPSLACEQPSRITRQDWPFLV